MSLKERVEAAMARAGIRTQRELAERISQYVGREVPPQTIQSIMSGRSKNSIYLLPIAMVCHVSAAWLQTGQGDMVDEAAGIAEAAADYGVATPATIAARIAALSPETWPLIDAFIDFCAQLPAVHEEPRPLQKKGRSTGGR